MPSRFERYRMRDGATALAERYFNPIWQDLDLRLAGLEELQVSWEAVVRTVTDFGLLRMNEVLAPAFDQINGQVDQAQAKVTEIEAKRQQALQAIADLQIAIATYQGQAEAGLDAFKDAATADIAVWKSTTLQALQTALAAVLPPLASLDGRLLCNRNGVLSWGDAHGLVKRLAPNLLGYSEQFNTAPWNTSLVTFSATDSVMSPVGTLTADTVAISAGGWLVQNYVADIAAGERMTYSLYSRDAAATLPAWGGSTPAGSVAYSVVNVGDGWYRHISTRTFSAATKGAFVQAIVRGPFTGVLWGAMLTRGGPAEYQRVDATAQPVQLATRTRYHLDTSGGPLALRMPAGAADDWLITTDIKRRATLNNITLDGNGAPMPEGDPTYVMDVSGESIYWVFDSYEGWIRG